MTNRYMRQLDYIDPMEAQSLPITVVGAGGIGSWTVLTLCKSGFKNITVFDDDVLEEHNISNQAYSTEQLEDKKVDAINEVLEFYGEGQVDIVPEKFDEDSDAEGVVIMAVDSMEARESVFDNAIKNPGVTHVIDGRMGLTTLEVMCVDLLEPDEVNGYRDTIDTEDAAELPCTAQTTMSTALVIAGKIVSRVVSILNNEDTGGREIYDNKSRNHIMVKG